MKHHKGLPHIKRPVSRHQLIQDLSATLSNAENALVQIKFTADPANCQRRLQAIDVKIAALVEERAKAERAHVEAGAKVPEVEARIAKIRQRLQALKLGPAIERFKKLRSEIGAMESKLMADQAEMPVEEMATEEEVSEAMEAVGLEQQQQENGDGNQPEPELIGSASGDQGQDPEAPEPRP